MRFSKYLAILLLIPAWRVIAMPVVELNQLPSHKYLFDAIEYVEDSSQTMTLEQARSLPSNQFLPLTKGNYNKGSVGSAFWMRIALHNADRSSAEWVIQHVFPTTDFVDFWIFVDDKVVDHAVGGDRTILSERQIPYRYPAVRHRSEAGEVTEVYIRVRNQHAALVQLLFRLDSSAEFLNQIAFDQIRLGVLYGVPLALSFSALVGWLVSRDRRFSLYAFYALAVIGSWLGTNGQLVQYLFIDLPTLSNNAMQIFFLLSVVFSAMFSRDFLHTREITPRIDQFMKFVIWACLGIILLRLAGVYTLVAQLSELMIFIYTIFSPVAGWFAFRKGVTHARWYIVAQLLFTLTIAMGIAMSHAGFGLYSYDPFIYREIAFLGELLLLSIAQYDRTRILARSQAVTAAENSRLYTEMETRVVERTDEITQAMKTLKNAQQQLIFREKMASIGTLTAGVAHEINNPANFAHVGAQVLRTDLERFRRFLLELAGIDADPKILESLNRRVDELTTQTETIIEGTTRIRTLVKDLRTFSRLDEAEKKSVPIADSLLSTIHLVRTHFAHSAEIKCDLTANPELECWPAQLNQVFMNLIVNACHAIQTKQRETGDPTPGILNIRNWVLDDELIFEFEDNGCGIPQGIVDRIFEPFFTTKGAGEGTGLGLSISFGIIEKHSGGIGVRSVEGEGSCFTVRLPLAGVT